MRLDCGWNQLQFNLADFARRAYGTNYIESLRVQVCLHQLQLMLACNHFMSACVQLLEVMFQICLNDIDLLCHNLRGVSLHAKLYVVKPATGASQTINSIIANAFRLF
jgi:hypothetical protein